MIIILRHMLKYNLPLFFSRYIPNLMLSWNHQVILIPFLIGVVFYTYILCVYLFVGSISIWKKWWNKGWGLFIYQLVMHINSSFLNYRDGTRMAPNFTAQKPTNRGLALTIFPNKSKIMCCTGLCHCKNCIQWRTIPLGFLIY